MQPELHAVYQIETKSDQTAAMQLYGQKLEFDQKIQLTHIFSVDSVYNDSSMVLSGKLTAVKMEIAPKSNKGLISAFAYDSGDKNQNKGAYKAYAYVFEKFLNQTYLLKVDKHGEILYNTRSELIEELAIDSLEESKNILEDDFATMFSVLPLEPVKTGDVYTKKIQTGTHSKINWENHFTVEKMGEEELVLGLKGSIQNSESAGASNEFNGTQSGTIVVDKNTGLVKSSEIDMFLEIKSADEQAILPTIKGKVTYVCSKIK